MSDRICIKCGQTMIPIKNDFYHLGPDGGVRSADLWGCENCHRFQVHGIPEGQFSWWPLYARVDGDLVSDPGSPRTFSAYLDPVIEFQPVFHKHMRTWYPDFKYR